MSGRRFTVYFAWDKSREADRPLGKLDNRFPALFEVRRAAWPGLEELSGGEQMIDGFLDRIVLGDFQMFLKAVQDDTGVAPTLVARRELNGAPTPIDATLLDQSDTLIVVSLDHCVTGQTPANVEVEAVSRFLRRPEAVLVVCPHHYIGGDDDGEEAAGEVFRRRVEEHQHHGDQLVPAVQRFGGYARVLLEGLGLPVVNLFGLRPATRSDGQPTPLEAAHSLDALRLLGTPGGDDEVKTFNAHRHLPHLQPSGTATATFRILARQHVDPEAPPHPFTLAGHVQFNALLYAPPGGDRGGHVVVCDATVWSAAFRGTESLRRFWANLARVPL
jgi:hypothetical protein